MKTNKQAIVIVLLSCLLCFGLTVQQADAFGKGAKGPDVYAVQGMLKTLGYYSGTIDGIYGPVLERGVRYFQSKYGLPITGAVDYKTLENILWAYSQAKKPKTTPAPAPSVPNAPNVPNVPKTPSAPGLTAEEQEMLRLINVERQKAGLPSLQADMTLTEAARLKSSDMIKNNYFSHQSPTYGSPFDMMKQFGITYTAAGENIACNQTVVKAHEALMQSSGHRANILKREYTHIGIGIVSGGPCGKMFTQMFIGK